MNGFKITIDPDEANAIPRRIVEVRMKMTPSSRNLSKSTRSTHGAAMTDQQNKTRPANTPGDWDFDSGFIVAPDPSGKHPDIYIAEIVTADDEGRIAPDEQRDANGHLLAKASALLKALEDAFTLIDRISDTLHYEDGLPVTALESRDIEIIYGDAVTELARFETLIRQARREI